MNNFFIFYTDPKNGLLDFVSFETRQEWLDWKKPEENFFRCGVIMYEKESNVSAYSENDLPLFKMIFNLSRADDFVVFSSINHICSLFL